MRLLACLIVAVVPLDCANIKSHSKRHHASKTVAPLPKAHSSDVISGNETGTLVSANWIQRYKGMEARHGKIAADGMIYMEGDKYRIPSQVADHFNEMVRDNQ